MLWIRHPRRLLTRILGFGTTVWLCRKFGCWARSFGQLSALMLRFVHRGSQLPSLPDYGHMLQDSLYPGAKPTPEAQEKARLLAEQSQKEERAKDALQLLGRAVLLAPPDASLYLARAKIKIRQKHWVEALDDAELCVSLECRNAEGWLAKGQAEYGLGRTTDAVLSYKAGLAADSNHSQLLAALKHLYAEPAPGIWQQLRELIFAAQLGLEKFFHTVEEPERATEAFVEANSSVLDAQLALLAQTLRVNTAVLLDSPMLCNAYEQIVYACSHLVAGAPAAFSNSLSTAADIVDGLALALRVGWHVHSSVPKVAANALVTLANCWGAQDRLRRQAVRHVLAAMLRWLLDARPEPDKEGEEVGSCSCTVPWKAASCFLERLLGDEPLRTAPWVRQECEAWPDSAQLCQWLTLSVRDFHATPLSLVGMLQFPRVAAAVMETEAIVNFFVVAPPFELLDPQTLFGGGPAEGPEAPPPSSTVSVAEASDAAAVEERVAFDAALPTSSPQSRRHEIDEDLILPPAQRLGEWLMASIGYLLLFIEDDALFTISACRAIHTLAMSDPGGDGAGRLLAGLWLGVPLLNKLSFYACRHTPALDLLHFLVGSKYPGVVVAARSLAQTLAGESVSRNINPSSLAFHLDESTQGSSAAAEEAGVEQNADESYVTPLVEEESAPSWAEFYHELLNELASPPDEANAVPGLVTLLNFEEKASMLTEQAVLRVDAGTASSLESMAVPAVWNRQLSSLISKRGHDPLPLLVPSEGCDDVNIGSEEYVQDARKTGAVLLMSRRSIRQSTHVENWAQAVAAAQKAGAAAVVVMNDLDAMSPFRMGLFGEASPGIPAFMISGTEGKSIISSTAASDRKRAVTIERYPPIPEGDQASGSSSTSSARVPPWPLTSARPQVDVAQAWSLFEALSHHEGALKSELDALLTRMSVPEKRVWLTRRLVRHHYGQNMVEAILAEMPLAFLECDRYLRPAGQLAAIRRQLCEGTGLGASELWGDFEVRFKDEQGVGSAVLREWIDMVAREVFLHPNHHLLRSYDRGQNFLPDPAALFCNPQWEMDFEALGRLLGLALWHSCTLDLPLHPHFCTLLFHGREAAAKVALANVDEDTAKLKVDWLLNNPIAELGFELPFTDSLGNDALPGPAGTSSSSSSRPAARERQDPGEGTADEEPAWSPVITTPAPIPRGHSGRGGMEAGSEVSIIHHNSMSSSSTAATPLPALVRFEERLPGNRFVWPGEPLREVGNAEVALGASDGPAIVTDENKAQYAECLRCWRTRQGIELQVAAVRRGLSTVVPHSVQQEMKALLSPVECTQLLSGMRDIDVDDWERHSVCASGLSRESCQVRWFWHTVRRWAATPEERIRLPQLLQFVTGSARVPVGGFRELVGFNGAKHPFTLARGAHLCAQSLPQAHACICTLDLPPYPDEATCASKLGQMLSFGREHFDEAVGTPNDA